MGFGSKSMSEGKITIIQPEHLPWLGYLDKIINAEVIVFLDNVQFKKRHFENRNRIRSKNKDGFLWLTVPVISKGKFTQKINEVYIDNSSKWNEKYIETLKHSYSKAPFFKEYFPKFEAILKEEYEKLVDLNIDLIKAILKDFGIEKKLLLASEISNEGMGNELIKNILIQLETKEYFSGSFGGLDENMLKSVGIHVEFQNFSHPNYSQIHGEFISNMSSIDLLFNHGIESLKILKGK